MSTVGRMRTAPADRSATTAIYYLLKPGHVSELHILPGDEVFVLAANQTIAGLGTVGL